MIIKDFEPFIGQHCETTTTGSLLKHIGINLSEPLLFGIGEGLGYIFWNMKTIDFPFIGGRIKPDVLTQNICRNLNLTLNTKQTSSIKKAWKDVQRFLDRGIPVGLKLDCYHLEYFTSKIHFAGHYASIYGYDEKTAYLNDTNQQGRNAKSSLENLARARNERGPMSSRNLSFTISKSDDTRPITSVIKKSIYNNTVDFLNPPIKNMGYKGILKTSAEIKKWFHASTNLKKDFQTCASIMENGGTGGSLFRNIYRDFLSESAQLLQCEELLKVSVEYNKIAKHWKLMADLFNHIGATQNDKYLKEASGLLIDLSEKEKNAMLQLQLICSKG